MQVISSEINCLDPIYKDERALNASNELKDGANNHKKHKKQKAKLAKKAENTSANPKEAA